jgi:peptidoglycan/LPS O-acetylase OafA/YrhL
MNAAAHPIETESSPLSVAPQNGSAGPALLTSSTRIAALDGIRGVAILLVLLCHVVFEMRPASRILTHLLAVGRLAWSGVDLFFVLSGFLIGGILLDVRDSPNYYKTFYLRRAYRILPLYGAMVALFSIRFFPVNWMPHWLGTFSEAPIPWFSYATFTQNIWMALYGTFGVGTMAATWSLAVEEQFYLTVPWLVRRISKPGLIRVLVVVVAVAPLLRTMLLWKMKYGHFANYVLMPCRADALCMGVLAALMMRSSKSLEWLIAQRRLIYTLAAFLFLVLAGMTYMGYDANAGPMVTAGYSFLALFYACFLLIGVTHVQGKIHSLLCSKWLMSLGGLAYFTYLVHLPMMEACRRMLGMIFAYSAIATQFVGGIIGVLVTVAFAKLSWKYFERPLLRKGHSYRY